MCAAYLAAKADLGVTMYEPSARIGGVLRGVEVFGENLDLGCHLFDNDSDELSKILFEFAGTEGFFCPVDPSYKSTLNGTDLSDIAVPDFGEFSDEELALIVCQIKGARESLQVGPKNLEELLVSRFGSHLGARLVKISRKLFQECAHNLDASVLEFSPFSRVRLRDNKTSEMLKLDPILDEVLAIRGRSLGQFTSASEYSCRNFYPKEGGTAAFVSALKQNLLDLGVEIVTGAGDLKVRVLEDTKMEVILDGKPVKHDYVFSTFDVDQLNKSLETQLPLIFPRRSVPMCLYYFQIDAKYLGDIAYLNNYSTSSSIFRASAPANYSSHSVDSELVHVCVECPTHINSKLWDSGVENSQMQVFEELISLSFLKGNAKSRDARKFNVPRTYTVKKVGYQQELDVFEAKIRNEMPNLLFVDGTSKSKSQLMTECLSKLEQVTNTAQPYAINY